MCLGADGLRPTWPATPTGQRWPPRWWTRASARCGSSRPSKPHSAPACACPARPSSTCRCGSSATSAGLPTGGSRATRSWAKASWRTRWCPEARHARWRAALTPTLCTTPARWHTIGAGNSICRTPTPRAPTCRPASTRRWRCWVKRPTTTPVSTFFASPSSTKTCTPKQRSTWRRRWASMQVTPRRPSGPSLSTSPRSAYRPRAGPWAGAATASLSTTSSAPTRWT
jgi:hypothetical protein